MLLGGNICFGCLVHGIKFFGLAVSFGRVLGPHLVDCGKSKGEAKDVVVSFMLQEKGETFRLAFFAILMHVNEVFIASTWQVEPEVYFEDEHADADRVTAQFLADQLVPKDFPVGCVEPEGSVHLGELITLSPNWLGLGRWFPDAGIPGHASHEKGLHKQIGVGTFVSSQEQRVLLVPRLNRL